MSLVWINGQLIDKAEARVSPFDHGFLYGDGVWEPLRIFRGELFRPADHLRQLFVAAHILGIDIPLSQSELTAAIEVTVRANNRTEGYVRVIVTRGPGTVGPDPRKIDPQVLIIAEEYYPFPLELYDHGLHVVTSHFRFDPPIAWWSRHRLLGQPHLVMAKREALSRGSLDALMLDECGMITGCTEGALFLVYGQEVRPLADSPPQVMEEVVVEVAVGLGLRCVTVMAGIEQLRLAGEVLLAGTACGVIGVVQVDGIDVGTGTEGPVTRQIREAYRKLTRGD